MLNTEKEREKNQLNSDARSTHFAPSINQYSPVNITP